MKILKYLIALGLFFILSSTPSYSQKKKYQESDYSNMEVEMADQMREDGKIYVVVAVVTTILVGLIVYTITIDRKISGLEKLVNQKTQKSK
jgi:ABC-type amino acid transport system permease subunit